MAGCWRCQILGRTADYGKIPVRMARVYSNLVDSLSMCGRLVCKSESSLESPVEMSSQVTSQYTMSITGCPRQVGTALY